MTVPGQKTILIIDDEEDFCFFVKANLQQLGPYQVVITTDGESGLKAARRVRPDCILLDIMMPGMSGFEVLENLKKDKATREIPVLMLTARADEESKQEGAQLYDDDYLVKPILAATLKERLERAMARVGK